MPFNMGIKFFKKFILLELYNKKFTEICDSFPYFPLFHRSANVKLALGAEWPIKGENAFRLKLLQIVCPFI